MNGDTSHFDIMVVGAGPAGSTSAAHAARGGQRVCLLERRADVATPIRCGEGIGLKGFNRSLGCNSEWIRTTITKVALVSPSGIDVTLKAVDQSYILDRSLVDTDLVKKAVGAGVVYHPCTPVTAIQRDNDGLYHLDTPNQRFLCRCVIIADGVESRLARQLGWNTVLRPKDIETCAFARVTHPSIIQDTVRMHVGRKWAPGGYVWVFPRGDRCANVGLGVLGSYHRAGDAKQFLERFIEHHFPGGHVRDLHCGGVPVGLGLRPLVREGAMVVGDAARQVHALAGAGLAYAVIAGTMAGEAACAAFASGSFDPTALRIYEKKWFSHYGKQQRRSYALKSTVIGFNDRFLDDVARAFSRRNPDRAGLLGLFLRVFSRHPRQLLRVLSLYR